VLKLSRQDQVWNRACLESGGPSPSEGDKALASLLLAHALAINGGVVHAFESMSRCEVTAAIAGYTYFGLTQAAHVFEQAPDESEETEERLNHMYRAAVPSDETLAHAFRVKLLSTPQAFAPTEPGAHA
jgi:hypothetical protein